MIQKELRGIQADSGGFRGIQDDSDGFIVQNNLIQSF